MSFLDEPNWEENLPLLGSWINCVSQCIVGVILEGDPRCWVPLGVFLPKTFLSVSSEPKFLTFTELHQQNVCVVSEHKKHL